MAVCEECEEKHDDDLLCLKCKRCLLANGQLLYEDDIGMLHFQCIKCQPTCIVDPSSFSDSNFSTEITPKQDPAELEKTFDQEWGTESEGDFPLDPPPKQIGSEERFKIWLKKKENISYDK